MALRRIICIEDELLRKKSRPVDKFDEKLHKLLDDMAETMYNANGVGLAAPQVAVLRRVVVMDCGDGIGAAGRYNRQLCAQKGWAYKGTAQIVMPENYLAMFATPEKDEAARIVAAANPVIDRAAARIAAGEGLEEKPSTLLDRLLSGAVNDVFYPLFVKDRAFAAGEKCTGCGACARLCPMKNITLSGGEPHWGGSCTHCMACISYCPTQAIEYGKKSVDKPRYHIEEVK